jgi:hypothetical protein
VCEVILSNSSIQQQPALARTLRGLRRKTLKDCSDF